jgi:hypothetical protein
MMNSLALRQGSPSYFKEYVMVETNNAGQGSAAAASPKWAQMGFFSKIFFCGKLVIFLSTFGFAFPLLLTD